MHDLRFYIRQSDLTAATIAERVGGSVRGDGTVVIVTVASSGTAEPGAMCFFEGSKPELAADVSPEASVCFIHEKVRDFLPQSVTGIVVEKPRLAFSRIANQLLLHRGFEENWDDLGPARIATSARVSKNAVICDGAEIGENAIIAPTAVIGPGVRIGADTKVGPGTVIECALIGNRVTIKSNTVIGGTGFGLVPTEGGLMATPHFGRVIIQDDVSIGSNCCVDRGVFEDTVIGESTQIDNLVQIAHNVTIGRNCSIAAFGGISGSCVIEDWVQMGGRVAMADHVRVGERARLAAYAGLMRHVPPGETWGGSPAKPLRTMLREMAWLAKNAAAKNRES